MNHNTHIYRKLISFCRLRGVERCQALKAQRDTTIKQLSRGVHNKNKLDGSRSYQEAVEITLKKKAEEISKVSRGVEEMSRLL